MARKNRRIPVPPLNDPCLVNIKRKTIREPIKTRRRVLFSFPFHPPPHSPRPRSKSKSVRYGVIQNSPPSPGKHRLYKLRPMRRRFQFKLVYAVRGRTCYVRVLNPDTPLSSQMTPRCNSEITEIIRIWNTRSQRLVPPSLFSLSFCNRPRDHQ